MLSGGVFTLADVVMAKYQYVCPRYDSSFVLRCGYSRVSYEAACAAELTQCDPHTRQTFRNRTFVCLGQVIGGQSYCSYGAYSMEEACANDAEPCLPEPKLP